MAPHSVMEPTDLRLALVAPCHNDASLKAAPLEAVAAVAAVPVAVPVVALQRNVHFADADVIEFEPTVWTSTVSSDGAPVGLSNKVRRRTRRRLDSYEEERIAWRILREEYMEHGYLEPEERLDILEAAGHAMATVHHVEHDTIRINRERWESNEHDLRYQYGLGEVVDLNAFEYEDEDLEQDQELELEDDSRFFRRDFVFDDEDDAVDFDDDDDEEMLEDDGVEAEPQGQALHEEDDDADSLHSYYYGQPTLLGDEEDDMHLAMDAMDSYDARKFDEWTWDYSNEAMLSDHEHDAVQEHHVDDDNLAHSGSLVEESPLARCHEDDDASVPYPEDLFDLHDLNHDISLSTEDDDGDFADMSTSPSDVTTFELPLLKPMSKKNDTSLTKSNAVVSTAMSSLPPYAIV